MAFLHSPSALDVQTSSDRLFDSGSEHLMPRLLAKSGDHTNVYDTDLLLGCVIDFPERITAASAVVFIHDQSML